VGLGFSPSYAVLGVLVVGLAFVVMYVLTSNTISDRKAKLANVQAQLAAQQAVAARLSQYVQFEQLAQTRVQTVRQISAARFDWYRALTNLSKVVPANTSLQSMTGTVAPGAGTSGSASGGGASSLRGDLSVPAFELQGCTKTQDDVARLMSRLRLINGVTRVTLGSSQKQGSGATATTSSAGSSAPCGANGPAFDLVVFFSALPGAGPMGVTSASGTPVSTSGATPAASTPASTTGATPAASTPASTTAATVPSTPASTTTGAAK
jgi:Tfp pilus assembly protein PilN